MGAAQRDNEGDEMNKLTNDLAEFGNAHLYNLESENIRLRDVNVELLDALQTLVDAYSANHVTVGDYNQARAAITKATGA
jgi:hypothetical protein